MFETNCNKGRYSLRASLVPGQNYHMAQATTRSAIGCCDHWVNRPSEWVSLSAVVSCKIVCRLHEASWLVRFFGLKLLAN